MGSEESTITASYVPSGTALRNATPAGPRSQKILTRYNLQWEQKEVLFVYHRQYVASHEDPHIQQQPQGKIV